MLMLLIPLHMIHGVISDRKTCRAVASHSIKESWSGEQSVVGSILFVPYEELRKHRVSVGRRLAVMPEGLNVTGNIETERRRRGLYRVPVYRAIFNISGSFSLRQIRQQMQQLEKKRRRERSNGKTYLAMFVSDACGLGRQPRLRWNDQEILFEAGGALVGKQINGMHVKLNDLSTYTNSRQQFSINFSIRGTESVSFSPLGKDTDVSLEADWPHPSFIGRYLPSDYHVDDKHFTAHWQVSSFS